MINNGRQLLVNGALIDSLDAFYGKLEKMLEWLKHKDEAAPYSSVERRMKKEGFEVGWGNTVSRISETIQTLLDLINEDQLVLGRRSDVIRNITAVQGLYDGIPRSRIFDPV